MTDTSQDNTLRAGLIGCGFFARSHAKLMAENGFQLAAVTSRSRESAEGFAQNHALTDPPPAICDSVEDLVSRDDLDLVVICSPPAVHAQQAIAALNAGKAVLCEKPSSLSPDDDAQIADAAAKSGRHIAFTSSRLRYGGYTDAARHAIETGRLGTVYRAEIRLNRPQHRPGIDWQTGQTWFTDRSQAGGGVLADMGGYLLDQMFHILGWPKVRSVDCTTFRGHPHNLPPDQVYDVEEHVNLFARLDPLSGQEGEIALSLDLSACAQEPAYHRVTLLGSEAGAEISHDPEKNSYRSLRYLPIAGKGGRGLVETANWDAAPWDSQKHYQLFARHLQGQGPGPGTTIAEARILTDLMTTAYQSAEQQAEMAI